ncbi:hypothetical protein [Auraticoccus monumenti]|uniref:Uncharacterized protein n=1 Tax=Auraticoccus monumenti TaxID=675864 RepID=A0A1G6WXY0_9ACTN|nr:hypothetical protein [Auraticoccus monumenti]SDD70659.1 hypothetical protein SAMN04489747_1558 [Auraticoccus monumenti]
MVLGLSLALTALCLAATVWAVVKILRRTPLRLDAPADRVLLGLLALVELGLLAQAVTGFVLVGSNPGVPLLSFAVYLVGVLLILPAGVFWALVDRTRAGAGVLVVACLTVPAIILRTHQVWGSGG